MTLAEDFESFLAEKVQLNPDRASRLQGHVDALDTYIEDATNYGPIFLSTIPAGSWAHRTIIKPVQDNDEFDADLLVEVAEHETWEARDYIEKLYDDLRANGTYKERVSRKSRCVRVNYAGDFHVDLVPYTERFGSSYITNRHEPPNTGSFELSNPDRFSEWVDSKDRASNDHFRTSMQLLKYLRDYKSTFTCKSIILMTLAGNATSDLAATLHPERYADLPTAFVHLLEDLAASLPDEMPAVMDPAGSGDNFADRYVDDWDYSNFRSKINDYSQKCRIALDETDAEASEALWQHVFGAGFTRTGVTRQASAGQSQARTASLKVRALEEQFIDEAPLAFPSQIQSNHVLTVTGRCVGAAIAGKTYRRGFRQYELPRRGNRVAKNRQLVFNARTNVPRPFELYWKVRNSGIEAKDSDALRGEITKDAGSLQKSETTSYEGTHYVEAYVVKDGSVVARDRQAVIVGSTR